ncbi:uncharacterized protein LOC143463457 isoform X2 [Clavelina lepadiformis]|uniref:uncharacterized protein LOC143463457 isoform X2 n=1 Tax=Clavelina lepadiformis TaxID=159417 RepID=UPI0040423F2B
MKTLPDVSKTNRSRHTALCDFCLGTSASNKHGVYEEMLFCKDCDAKAHPSCMKYSKALAAKASSYPWQCVECKTCSVCCSSRDGASILFCDACDKAYHMKCHSPEVDDKPEGKWICSSCIDEDLDLNGWEGSIGLPDMVSKKANDVQSDDSSNATGNDATSSNHSSNIAQNYNRISIYDNVIPNSADWTANEVAEYFKSLGFSEQASVFTREEIDGRSLLLLRRADVIAGLSLKLGPAVKIFEHITKLQNASLSKSSYHNGIK